MSETLIEIECVELSDELENLKTNNEQSMNEFWDTINSRDTEIQQTKLCEGLNMANFNERQLAQYRAANVLYDTIKSIRERGELSPIDKGAIEQLSTLASNLVESARRSESPNELKESTSDAEYQDFFRQRRDGYFYKDEKQDGGKVGLSDEDRRRLHQSKPTDDDYQAVFRQLRGGDFRDVE